MANASFETVKECLIGNYFAPAQQLPILIHDATEPRDGDLHGDWEIQGIFNNNHLYKGSLSGLGIRLEPAVVGLVDLRAMSGLKPLIPEAYIALESMKSNSANVDQIQPWTRLIGFALDRDDSVDLQSADDTWLEREFTYLHCKNVIPELTLDDNGYLYSYTRKTPKGIFERRYVLDANGARKKL